MMPTNIDLKKLRVAVTGGTSGLGLALVRLLSARGARVAFVARTAGLVRQIAQETGAFGIVGDANASRGKQSDESQSETRRPTRHSDAKFLKVDIGWHHQWSSVS